MNVNYDIFTHLINFIRPQEYESLIVACKRIRDLYSKYKVSNKNNYISTKIISIITWYLGKDIYQRVTYISRCYEYNAVDKVQYCKNAELLCEKYI